MKSSAGHPHQLRHDPCFDVPPYTCYALSSISASSPPGQGYTRCLEIIHFPLCIITQAECSTHGHCSLLPGFAWCGSRGSRLKRRASEHMSHSSPRHVSHGTNHKIHLQAAPHPMPPVTPPKPGANKRSIPSSHDVSFMSRNLKLGVSSGCCQGRAGARDTTHHRRIDIIDSDQTLPQLRSEPLSLMYAAMCPLSNRYMHCLSELLL